MSRQKESRKELWDYLKNDVGARLTGDQHERIRKIIDSYAYFKADLVRDEFLRIQARVEMISRHHREEHEECDIKRFRFRNRSFLRDVG